MRLDTCGSCQCECHRGPVSLREQEEDLPAGGGGGCSNNNPQRAALPGTRHLLQAPPIDAHQRQVHHGCVVHRIRSMDWRGSAGLCRDTEGGKGGG